MEGFEERRKKYFEDLKKYKSYIMELSKDEKNKEMMEILIFPKNEEELNLANGYIKFLLDTIELRTNALYDNVEELDLNNSVAINFITDTINLIYNNASVAELNEKMKYITDYKVVAEISYQLTVFMIQCPEEFLETISNRCNIDIDDELELVRFQVIFNQAMEKIKLDTEFKNDNKCDMKKQMDFFKEYHELCVKGIKQNNDSPKQKFKF